MTQRKLFACSVKPAINALRAFLKTVFGCGLRLSEATHVQICDIDSPRFQLLVPTPRAVAGASPC